MATTISNGESGSSVRTKLNNIWEGLQINEIDSSIADTAVDVFVYDTRKDSDGGAWRKRTQHTSWYNETLNTATRGSRKEFPAVAVIVAESSQVTIYDGDDPDLPMWMVFEGGFSTYSTMLGAGTVSSLSAINAQIGVGTTAGTGLRLFNFLKDNSYVYDDTESAGFVGLSTANIEERNEFKIMNSSGASLIVNDDVNDVAMTVLPNAPIDAATGLPVPTIAVATNGGVSVIKDDGTVVDSASTSIYHSVMFNGSDLYAEDTSFADDTQYYGDAGSLSDSFPTFRNFYSYSPAYERLSSSTLSNFSGNILSKMGEPRSFAVGLAADTGSSASWTALNMVADHSGQNQYYKRTALVSYINSSFNTGWMNGDIKLATLSDTDDTDVTGSELVTNGTFDTDTTGWTARDGTTISQVSGKLRVTSGAAGYGTAWQAISCQVGKTYQLSVDISFPSTAYSTRVMIDTASTFAAPVTASTTVDPTTGTKTVTFVADAATLYVGVQVFTATVSSAADFDNISVRLAEEDRSVNGNGLQVFGSITKDPVATGADLVGYSGFSSSNYLEQPYNADLEVGTGDISFMGWVKKGSSTGYQIILQRDKSGDNVGTGSFEMAILNTTGQVLAQTYDGAAQTATSTSAVSANTWSFICGVIDAGVLKIYFNGVLEDTVTPTALSTSGEDVLTFGIRTNHSSNPMTTGSLALWRISATAPSPEQIARIYNDEKHLFTEGAQATLYGSSDSVTALAFDDTTNLLHVGTSAGRSVFQGLRRVNNTTTGVTTSISASNGLIVEQ